MRVKRKGDYVEKFGNISCEFIFLVFFLSTGIILWIELPWPENLANTYAQHRETLDCYFDLIRSHQQCIPWSPPLEIELATINYRAETLQLSQLIISPTRDAKWRQITNHAQPINLNVSYKLHPYTLQRTRSSSGPRLPKRIRYTLQRNYYDLKDKGMDVYFILFYF